MGIDSQKIYSNFGPLNTLLISRLASRLKLEPWQLQTVANATLGIEGALATSGIASTSKWATPAWTFTATASACVRSGIEFEFIDIDSDWRADLNVNFTGLVDVLPFGDNLNFNRKNFNSLECIVVDAAASFDALEKIELRNDIPIAIIISLHATKSLPAGEGGIFITNRKNWSNRFKSWTNFGIHEERISNFVGTNAKMSEFNCAIALASLDKWDQTKVEIKTRNVKAKKILRKYNLSTTPALDKNFATPYWIVKFNNSEQKAIIKKWMEKSKISTRDWWNSGCHNMPAYKTIQFKSLDNTNQAFSTSLGLPFHHELTEEYWEQIDDIFLSHLN